MLTERQRVLDDLTELESYVQVAFEVEDRDHQQIVRITVEGIYEGLLRCRKTRRWYFTLRDNSEQLRVIRTSDIIAIYQISNS